MKTVILFLAITTCFVEAKRPPRRRLNKRKAPNADFFETSFSQLQYIFSDNNDCVSALQRFSADFSRQNQKVPGNSGNAKSIAPGQNSLTTGSSASIQNNTASATSSDTFSGNKTLIISGSNGQFVRNPTNSGQDSMRVYNIGEVMIDGVVAFVEIQASLLRNGNYYLDAKINEHNDGAKVTKDGVFKDSRTVSRKVVLYDKKFGFGASEIYVIEVRSSTVDFKIYTIASALNFKHDEIISSVIIDLKHVQMGKDGSMTVEQATLTSTSDCSFEQTCKVVNLGSIKVNGDLLSKLVQAKAISGVNYEKKVAVVSQMYSQQTSQTRSS
jgi:hypothetical protein